MLITHQYPKSGGVFEVCITTVDSVFSSQVYRVLNASCCYEVEVPPCDNITCDSIDISWEECAESHPDTCCITLSYDAPFPHNNYAWTISENDSTIHAEITGEPYLDYDFIGVGPYEVCVQIILGSDTLNCCEDILLPPCECCMDADFEMDSLDYSCQKRQYVVDPVCDSSGITRHVWIFNDGTEYHGYIPPPHVFTNFYSDGQVCITHQVYCGGVLQDEVTHCMNQIAGAYLGYDQETTRMSDILWNYPGDPTVYEFLTSMAGSGISVLIDGDLVVDIDVEFEYGVWNMGRQSTIIVEQHQFDLENTKIRSAIRENPGYSGCCRWQGIEVEEGSNLKWLGAFVHDADTMLYLLPGSGNHTPMDIQSCYFEENLVGIQWDDHHGSFSNFHDNHFVNPADCGQYCGCCYNIAIRLNNVSHGVIFPFTDTDHNGISGYDHGVYSVNTNLNIQNFHIEQLRESTTAIGGNGVWFIKEVARRIMLTMDRMHFDGMQRGFRAVGEGGGYFVIDADASSGPPSSSITMKNLQQGYDIETHGSTRLLASSIYQNDIEAGGGNENFGIRAWAIGSSQNSILIKENEISVADVSSSLGIILLSTIMTSQSGRVYENDVNVVGINDDGAGIYVENWLGTHVVENHVDISDPKTGIEINDGGFNLIKCNNVLHGTNGLTLFDAESNNIIGNYLFDQDVSMRVNADCMGSSVTEIQRNVFEFSFAPSNVYSQTGITGIQDHEEYNEWKQQNGNEVQTASGGAWTQNYFWAPSNASIGSIHRPQATDSRMFDASQNPPNLSAPCQSGGGSDPQGPFGLLSKGEEYAFILDSTDMMDSSTVAERVAFEQSLLLLLEKFPNWTDSIPRLDSFYNEKLNEWSGKTAEIYWDLHVALEDRDTAMLDVESDLELMRDYSTDLDSLEEELRTETDSSTIQSLISQVNGLIQQIDSLESLVEADIHDIDSVYWNDLSDVNSTIGSLGPSQSYQEHEVFALKVILDIISQQTISSANRDSLHIIASQCFEDGGRAVYMAQALLLGLDEGYHNIYNCSTQTPGALKQVQNNKPSRTLDVIITPNPAESYVEIQLLDREDLEQWEVRLYSMTGGLIKVLNVDSGLSGVMSLEDIYPGTYVLEVHSNEQLTTRKLIIK